MLKPVYGFLFFFTLLFNALQSYAADVELYLVRHGETRFNKSGRVQGWADSPLTPAGIKTAEALGKGLKTTPFNAVWTSDTGRARETARLITQSWASNPPLHESRALREISYGQFEGQPNKIMWDAAAGRLGFTSQKEVLNGFAAGKVNIADIVDAIADSDKGREAEHYQQAASRLKQAIDSIVKEAQQKGGGNVLIVTHGMAITVLLHELGNDAQRKPLKNASVTRVRYSDAGNVTVEAVDDTRFVNNGLQKQ